MIRASCAPRQSASSPPALTPPAPLPPPCVHWAFQFNFARMESLISQAVRPMGRPQPRRSTDGGQSEMPALRLLPCTAFALHAQRWLP